jgi:hypothetical protein
MEGLRVEADSITRLLPMLPPTVLFSNMTTWRAFYALTISRLHVCGEAGEAIHTQSMKKYLLVLSSRGVHLIPDHSTMGGISLPPIFPSQTHC